MCEHGDILCGVYVRNQYKETTVMLGLFTTIFRENVKKILL